ncbi:SpaA isopeptide-forming pilin-related protein [Bifidobacterium thermophilum]|nr:SpaA isopeptide-forming pilin-related protein [Bifidobacterium thermophilum]
MILPPIIAIDSRRSATAADTTTAGLCDPTTNVHYGDGSTDITASDTGIATYVGGNMYVGSPKSGVTWGTDAINGSYAAEAEGQTVVRGDLLARPIKTGSDGKSFFTLGMVAFGAQYLPAAGTTILAVGGTAGAISTLGGGNDDHAQAWNAPVGIKSKAATSTSTEYGYKAYIAGKQSTVWDNPATPSVKAYTNTSSNAVTWSGTTGLKDSGITGAQNYDSKIAKLSSDLSQMTANGIVTNGVAPTGSYTRYKYDSSKPYGMTFTNDPVTRTVGSQTYSGVNNEKVLYFSGDGHSNNQVFNVTLSQLKSDGYRGLDFAFSNIPANASVIINVVKDDGSSLASTDSVNFNTGWRFWWNNDEISNGYVTSGNHAVDSSISKAYVAAGESIMWNFGNAGSVTIGGGKAYEGLGYDNNASLDDPAAAMLGSILLASGSFDDHVTTNGRVWVGGDFMMNNPTGNANGASTASVIDMDQERHNLPWASNGSSCAAIGWWKYGSDASGVPVGGSSWGVFAKEQDASNDENAILYVTDNSTNDWSSQSGSLEVHGLNINATYYVREVSPPEGYKNNDNVYTVSTTSDWARQDTNLKSASGVYMVKNTDANGKAVCGTIYNICDEPSTLKWKKVASDGSTLPGSKWSLTNKDTNAEYEVDDLTEKVTGLTLTSSKGTSLNPGGTDQTKVTVEPTGATSAIRYASTDTNVVSVNSTGLITAHAAGKAQVVAYAGDKKSTIQVSVFSSGSTTSTDTGGPISIRGASIMQPNEQQRLMLRQDGMALADPSVATWTSSNPSVATVTGGNVTTGACASASGCLVTITAQYQGYTDTFNITVASSNVVTWKSPVTIYYYTPRRPSWNAHYLHYAFVKNGSPVFDNGDIKMEPACSNWVKATVTNADALPLVVTFTDTPYQSGTTQTNAHWDSNNSKNYYLGAGYDTYVFDQESNGTNHTAPSCYVTSLSVTGNNVAKDGTMTMQANTTSQLNATIEPAGAANVTWASDNTTVATVDGTGLVTARKAGTATITATAGGQQALINLTVRPQADGEVIVDGNDEMIVGRTQTLTAQLDGKKDVTITSWESSNPAIATVDQTGRVTAVSPGTINITATGYAKAAGPGSGSKTGAMSLRVVTAPPYWNDADATDGKFTVNGLPDGSYKLCETTPPSGYAAGGTCYTFTLSAGEVTASTIPKTNDINTIKNVPTTVKWSKVDADDKTTLDGSAWKITSQDGKSVWCVADGGTTTSKVTNCTGSVMADTDGKDDGTVTVTGLPAGTYTLNEVQAPKGYELSTASYTMIVSGTASKKSTVDGKADRGIPNLKSYGRVSWAKYDETAQSDGTHQALKGSDWQLFRCKSDVTSPSAVSSEVCKDPVQTFDGTSRSRFEYDSLLLNTYYLLVETKAPDGYLLGDAPYYAVKATSAATPATITPLSKDSAVQGQVGTRTDDGTYPIDNRKAATATWKKTEYGSGTALEGSEWTLTQYADATASSALRVYKITYTASTGSATQGSYAMSCTVGTDPDNPCSARYEGKLSVTSPKGASALSVFSVSGLPWGYYMLTETKAPAGHVTGASIAGKTVDDSTAGSDFTINYGTVTNETSITSLPLTGGEWTPRNVVIAGLIVLGVAAVSYGIARRRRRK